MRVLVTGIFDLLHVEHVRFLAKAKNLIQNSEFPGLASARPRAGRIQNSSGCYLIVGIESDKRVKSLKGEGRPVMGQEDRKEMLEGLKMVDEVMILADKFDSDDDYLKLLRDVKPDIYAVSENSPFMENKRKICDRAGVTLKVVHEYNPEYSTTELIRRISAGCY